MTGRWDRMRAQVLAAQPVCRGCDQPSTFVVHVYPFAKGGRNIRANLAGALRQVCPLVGEEKALSHKGFSVEVCRICRRIRRSGETLATPAGPDRNTLT